MLIKDIPFILLFVVYIFITPNLVRNLWILSKTPSDITFSFVAFMCCWTVCGVVGGIHSLVVSYAIIFEENGKAIVVGLKS